jgi:hypothetical protein
MKLFDLGLAIILGVSVLAFSACQPTGGLTTPEAAEAGRIFARHCVVGTDRDGYFQQGPDIGEDITIFAIEDGERGWARFEVQSRGVRDYVYRNKRDGRVVCGDRSWRKIGVSFVKADMDVAVSRPSLTQTEEQHLARRSNCAFRSVAFEWEGHPDLFAVTMELCQEKNAGAFSFKRTDNAARCNGTYDYGSGGTGFWKLTCTDGATASGVFSAGGQGKGSTGIGVDSEGRRVRYTIAPVT